MTHVDWLRSSVVETTAGCLVVSDAGFLSPVLYTLFRRWSFVLHDLVLVRLRNALFISDAVNIRDCRRCRRRCPIRTSASTIFEDADATEEIEIGTLS